MPRRSTLPADPKEYSRPAHQGLDPPPLGGAVPSNLSLMSQNPCANKEHPISRAEECNSIALRPQMAKPLALGMLCAYTHRMTYQTAPVQLALGSTVESGYLYAQLAVAVRREVAAARLAPHDLLPSIRAFAADLRISAITVRRAYDNLEREGIVYKRPGLGSGIPSS